MNVSLDVGAVDGFILLAWAKNKLKFHKFEYQASIAGHVAQSSLEGCQGSRGHGGGGGRGGANYIPPENIKHVTNQRSSVLSATYSNIANPNTKQRWHTS